jgi:ABC-type antimicrobial peptide transport system permease subunit
MSAEIPLWDTGGEFSFEAAAEHLTRLQLVLDRVAGLPGVEEVAVSADRLGFVPTVDTVRLRRAEQPESARITAQRAIVSGAYFRLLDIPTVAGRVFGDRVGTTIDWQDPFGGVVVDTTLATMMGGIDHIVGRQVIVGFTPTTVVGVVAPTKSRSPDEAVAPRVYLRYSPNAPLAQNLLVKFAGPHLPVSQAVARVVQQELGMTAPPATVLLADELARLQRPYRSLFTLALALASVAGGLALLGLLAVARYALARRRKEAAVRLAVGATPISILRLCLRDVVWAMPVGCGAGLVLGVQLGRQLESRLFGVSATDPLALLASTLGMTMLMIIGFAIPVRHLVRSNLLPALRDE